MTTPLDRQVAMTISSHFGKGRSAKQVFDHLVDNMHVDVTTATDAIIAKQLTWGPELHMPAKQRILLPEYGGVTSFAAAFVIALLKFPVFDAQKILKFLLRGLKGKVSAPKNG